MSLGSDNVVTGGTLGPHALATIVLFVVDKSPARGNLFTTLWTPTKGRFIRGHGKGWKERVTVFLPVESWVGANVSLWRVSGPRADSRAF